MKTARVLCSLFLLIGLLVALMPGTALADDEEVPAGDNVTVEEEEPAPEVIAVQEEEEEEPTSTDRLIIRPAFPTVEAIAGGEFEYEMELLFVGTATTVFDLNVTAPQGWEVHMTPRYEPDKKISSITLQPTYSAGEHINVVATAPFWPIPDPGDYDITIEAVSTSGDVTNSVDLTARITAKYILLMSPSLESYQTTAESGKDNFFAVDIGNLGTAPIENIDFISNKPEGWTVEFQPEKIEELDAFDTETLDINIKPPKDTIAGDYYVSVRASGKQTSSDEMQIRVTVKTSATWQWIGVAIIVIVVAGVIFVFMRFSRR